MPKIQWDNLPRALRDHLFDRLRERRITVDDLYRLKLWRESRPEAPDGLWFKDFNSFKVCGEPRHGRGGEPRIGLPFTGPGEHCEHCEGIRRQ